MSSTTAVNPSPTEGLDRTVSRPWTFPFSGGAGAIVARVTELKASRAVSGERPTLVFMHGLVGLNEHWEDVALRIGAHADAVMFELPLLQLPDAYCSIDGVTAITSQFLRSLGRGPYVLAGNSFGGHVALRVAIEEPALVRGLVLAGSSGVLEVTSVASVELRPSRPWLEQRIAELFHDRRFMRAGDLDRAYAQLSQRSCARAMVRLSRSARRDVLIDRLHMVGVPTLLLWGRQDIVTPLSAAHMFHQRIKRSKLVVYDRCGHVPMIENAPGFARDTIDFLSAMNVVGEGASS